MLEKKINYKGYDFVRKKKIKGKKYIYVEYRNDELQKAKFFEVHDGNIKEITDKEDLKYAIKNNYIVKEDL